MAFPDPNDGNSTHVIGSKVWNWDGEKWVLETVNIGSPVFAATNPVQVDNQPSSTTYSLDASTLDSLTTDTSTAGTGGAGTTSSGGY